MTPVTVIDVSLGVCALSFAISLVRIALGPSTADRGLAADVGYLNAVGAVALLAVRSHTAAFADVVLVATLVGFLATLGFAWLIERRSS